MALEAHIAELKERHQSLEREIEGELHHPSSDNLHIAKLKKRKLMLKEQITRLSPKLRQGG